MPFLKIMSVLSKLSLQNLVISFDLILQLRERCDETSYWIVKINQPLWMGNYYCLLVHVCDVYLVHVVSTQVDYTFQDVQYLWGSWILKLLNEFAVDA